MTLPVSGNPISLNQVNVELGLSATAQISMNDAAVRTLFGVGGAGTTNTMSNGHGKSNIWVATINSHQADLNLRNWAIANGWNGTVAAFITIAPGIYIYATSTGNAAMTVNGSWPAGVTITNNGYIMGMGGTGAGFVADGAPSAAVAGGSAISLGVSVVITNNSYIGGGGGGGGACYATNAGQAYCGGGGGAGGGLGGGKSSGAWSVAYAAGGGLGGAGSNGGTTGNSNAGGGAGGGGGRIFPGTGGGTVYCNNSTSGGYGGGAGGSGACLASYTPCYSGAGGSSNGAGGVGTISGSIYIYTVVLAGGGGGGWGAAGGNGYTYRTFTTTGGAAGGRAVQLNGYSVTWNATGTVYGAVS